VPREADWVADSFCNRRRGFAFHPLDVLFAPAEHGHDDHLRCLVRVHLRNHAHNCVGQLATSLQEYEPFIRVFLLALPPIAAHDGTKPLSARNEVSVEQCDNDLVGNVLIIDGELDLANAHGSFLTSAHDLVGYKDPVTIWSQCVLLWLLRHEAAKGWWVAANGRYEVLTGCALARRSRSYAANPEASCRHVRNDQFGCPAASLSAQAQRSVRP
jgi:hypothetical protein